MRHDEHSSGSPAADSPDREPIVCQLANGHAIKIAAAHWSRSRSYEDWASGLRPEPYFAIRIYCTENTLPKRLAWIEEFCEETDFPLHDFDSIWSWLTEFCKSREVFAFDDLCEFLDHVTDRIIQLSTPEFDAVEHLKHFSESTDPEDFYNPDDSIYTDQNQRDSMKGS